MNQQPDKLFHQKLEGLSKAVPAGAWNKVEMRLKKNNSKGLWLKIAASIMLLAVAAFFLWKKNPIDTSLHITQNKINTKQETLKQKQDTLSAKEDVAPQIDKVTPLTSSKKSQVKKQPLEKSVMTEQKAEQTEVAVVETQQEIIATASDPALKEKEAVVQASIAEQTADELAGITLVFTAEEMAEKYLDKKSLTKATSANKKTSTLRKLLDKAYDLKHNQDPFGELRQKKNEILALNFKNEKQRSQNK